MRDLARPLFIVVFVLLVPIVPFLALGNGFEQRIEDWLGNRVSKSEIAWSAVMLLASDVVLPVPSSMVSTLTGARLGIVYGTAVSWLGMTIGAVFGFALARWFGEPLARRFTGNQDWNRLQQVTGRFGFLALAITRAVPVLAEATVLLLGTTKVPWNQFLLVVGLSNLAIAMVYAVLGWISFEHGQLALAIVASIALPAAITLFARRLWSPEGPTGAEGI